MSQKEIRVQELWLDEGKGTHRNISLILNQLGMLKAAYFDIDVTAGDNASISTDIPAGSLLIAAAVKSLEALAGGTSVFIGDGTDPNGILHYSAATTTLGESIVCAGALMGTVDFDGTLTVDVTGTYTAGEFQLKIVYLDSTTLTGPNVGLQLH